MVYTPGVRSGAYPCAGRGTEMGVVSTAQSGMAPSGVAGMAGTAPITPGLHPLAVLLILSLLIPINFTIGETLLSATRVLCLVIVPVLLVRLLQGAYGRPVLSDYAILFFLFWMVLTVSINHGIAKAISYGGSNGFMILGGYLTARATIRSPENFFALTRFLAVVVIFLLLPLGVYEAFFHNPSLILDWLANLLGEDGAITAFTDSDMCCRMGLTRAQTVFTHPIHFGLFCAMAFAPYFIGLTNHVSLGKRLLVGTLIVIAAFTSVSSGSLLVIMFQMLLIAYAWGLHRFDWQWRALLWVAAIGYVLIELNTTKPAPIRIAEALALSRGTVWARELQFEAGIEIVQRYPIFGWGVRPLPNLPHYMHSSSVDNYWLVLAFGFGIPAFAAAITAFIWAMIFAGGKRFRKGSDLYYVRVSWTILLIGVCLAIGTVHIWSTVQPMVYFMLASGLFLFYANEPDAAPVAPTIAETRRRSYTRFPADRVPGPLGPRRPPRPGNARRAPSGRGRGAGAGRGGGARAAGGRTPQTRRPRSSARDPGSAPRRGLPQHPARPGRAQPQERARRAPAFPRRGEPGRGQHPRQVHRGRAQHRQRPQPPARPPARAGAVEREHLRRGPAPFPGQGRPVGAGRMGHGEIGGVDHRVAPRARPPAPVPVLRHPHHHLAHILEDRPGGQQVGGDRKPLAGDIGLLVEGEDRLEGLCARARRRGLVEGVDPPADHRLGPGAAARHRQPVRRRDAIAVEKGQMGRTGLAHAAIARRGGAAAGLGDDAHRRMGPGQRAEPAGGVVVDDHGLDRAPGGGKLRRQGCKAAPEPLGIGVMGDDHGQRGRRPSSRPSFRPSLRPRFWPGFRPGSGARLRFRPCALRHRPGPRLPRSRRFWQIGRPAQGPRPPRALCLRRRAVYHGAGRPERRAPGRDVVKE